MDKNAIKKYAVWARRELISRVSQKALQYGISEENIGDANADTINGHLLTAAEKQQRQALIAKIKKDGYQQAMEEAAYTWFNRFCALRYMEVNGYLPTHVRVFSDEQNNFKPQIIAEAIHLELDGLDMEKVYALKEENKTDELYKYLLITQCNALSVILPGMFRKIADYTELLFPDNLLREGSAIEQMIALIPEEDWTDQVQIIGWLYQYYNTELKDKVFADLKKNIKISKENIPAATQLFTPDWIVHYMVENSLGRLWVEGHPNDKMKASWKYYLEEAEQEPEVQKQLAEIRAEYAQLKPEDIRVIDPCMGSGHILVVMFDVLVQIYESYGYSACEAASMIVEHNLYGLDIDERAAQLSYFAVMMKARKYAPRFLSRNVQPHVYSIVESNNIDAFTRAYFINGDANLKKNMDILMNELRDAKEYGSILNVTKVDFSALYARLAEVEEDISIHRESALNIIKPLIQVAEVLAQKYSVTCTNPPYATAKGLAIKLREYLANIYPTAKYDLFGAFIVRCLKFTKKCGYIGLVTPVSLLYNPSFQGLRREVIGNTEFSSLIELGSDAFESGFGTATYSIVRYKVKGYVGRYFDVSSIVSKDKFRGTKCFYSSTDYFPSFDGEKVMYKLNDDYRSIITEAKPLSKIGNPRIGMQTNDNSRFLRLWHEIESTKLCTSHTKVDTFGDEKWFPIVKGGGYRKWYGNIENVVNWQHNGAEIRELNKNAAGGRIVAEEFYFCEGLTWTHTTYNQPFSMRYMPEGTLINVEGPAIFSLGKNQNYVLGCLNSVVARDVFKKIVSSIHFSASELGSFPLIVSEQGVISDIVKENILQGMQDWNAYETSWDFQRHPMLSRGKLADAYAAWKADCESRFLQLKANEEKLNRIFIDIYGLQEELTPDVAEKDVTVHRVFDTKDAVPESMKGSNYVRTMRDEVVSLISYAVGCMFGRYSMDVDGLAYAGGAWDGSKYQTFMPDKDNIIPICDDDYFDDDITGRFIKWVETVYGANPLEENLKFIANALGGKGSAREVIRNYFISDFYADHLKTYQKRPIYWLFDSGKKGGFKALSYMHRYQPDTIARIRTDYVHEQQSRYRTAIADLQQRINGVSTGDRVKLTKQLTKLEAQAEEIRTYEEKIHHLADQMIPIDLDDGVKVNYAKFADVLAKIK